MDSATFCCGAAHFAPRTLVIVLTPERYGGWVVEPVNDYGLPGMRRVTL